MLNFIGCFQTDSFYGLFQEGLNKSQAQNESNTIYYSNTNSVYWYALSAMTAEICLRSCLKYGYYYSGVNNK